MDLSTVSAVVEALIATYAAGLDYYTKWQHRKWQENHYQTRNRGKLSQPNLCGLSASLSFSPNKIKEVFDSGVEIFGTGFSAGDDICRESLQCDLGRLQERIYALRKATRAGNGPLELFELIRMSESVRISCLAALASQYKRVAVGRLVPQVLPGTKRRSKLSVIISEEETAEPAADNDGGSTNDNDNAADCVQVDCRGESSSKLPHPHPQSEPPSPPLTPKQIPDDLQSIHTTMTNDYGLQPKNSVFSMFCPEALEYQVNTRKAMPEGRNCRCGYDWGRAHTEDKTPVIVKEGFEITPRFLGKSHCDGGFGCVLCTSSGRTETYTRVEDLKDHINESHSKWQLLHDQDMAGR
ncbi:uncharacterized protein F4812DRAFT_438418 [Daldinia caldariorum]|uniref:uncharacterized protein n=1 Tax=Daldinia caldariorum TaxID=326644 RepID=UPI00200868E5|nr:uncharacterized protein F4812DRAFT_438418 [Daldinia caldariorum]KAI1465362.1 hypothetical protein F4812DRAFT_438418 [Daldinia caldariorum]